jgi:hypothetical protein
VKVIARADDSSGIIGCACRALLDLHSKAAAGTPAGRLVDWMITFLFDGDVDYFELDPVASAPALGSGSSVHPLVGGSQPGTPPAPAVAPGASRPPVPGPIRSG